MREIVLVDAADQTFATTFAGKPCEMRWRFNPTSDRWSFDLSIEGVEVLRGRRLVLGIDLLAAFDFGIGALFAVDYARAGAVPDYRNVIDRKVRIFQHDEAGA